MVTCNLCFVNFSVFPTKVDGVVATGFDSVDFSFLPCRRECREQLQMLAIALHEHLADACCPSEIAIYLEWRVSIEKVRISTSRPMASVVESIRTDVGEQLAEQLVCLV